jgi:hypothetical protein
MDMLSDKAIETLIAAAVAAPSGDNTQPWRFEVDRSSRKIAIRVDETRDPSPMNCGQRMARIAVGAAAENILVVAEGLGWQAQLETPPAGVAAMVKVTPSEAGQMDVAPVIRTRVTNRRVYDGRPVPDEVLAELAAETPADAAGVTTHWIGDRDRIATIATTVANSDGVMFGLREMLDAFLSKVRFDLFFLGNVRRNQPIGGGFWLVGIEFTEYVSAEHAETLAALFPLAATLLSPAEKATV